MKRYLFITEVPYEPRCPLCKVPAPVKLVYFDQREGHPIVACPACGPTFDQDELDHATYL